jgi:hypothetical protein
MTRWVQHDGKCACRKRPLRGGSAVLDGDSEIVDGHLAVAVAHSDVFAVLGNGAIHAVQRCLKTPNHLKIFGQPRGGDIPHLGAAILAEADQVLAIGREGELANTPVLRSCPRCPSSSGYRPCSWPARSWSWAAHRQAVWTEIGTWRQVRCRAASTATSGVGIATSILASAGNALSSTGTSGPRASGPGRRRRNDVGWRSIQQLAAGILARTEHRHPGRPPRRCRPAGARHVGNAIDPHGPAPATR